MKNKKIQWALILILFVLDLWLIATHSERLIKMVGGADELFFGSLVIIIAILGISIVRHTLSSFFVAFVVMVTPIAAYVSLF